MDLYLFFPVSMYSHGCTGVAADSPDEAYAVLRAYYKGYWASHPEFAANEFEHVGGVTVDGAPRVLFDHSAEE
jgi:hypothetical protein